MLLAKKQ